MSLGMADRFDILQRSPHDSRCASENLADTGSENSSKHWVPSRYNIRAKTDDGRLVLWNSLSGKMTVFEAQEQERLLRFLSRKGVEAPEEGGVRYLVDRGYLVPKGVDEFRKFQMLFGKQHYRSDLLELILMSSEDCNFRCTYCYEKFARGTMTPEVRERVKKLVRKRIPYLRQLRISWFGGEPLYGMEAVEDLGPFFVEIAREFDIPYSSQMTTNAYLLTPAVAEKLLSWRINQFQITLDGLPEHHDCNRKARDGSPTFATIYENLKSLAQRDAWFQVMLRVNFDQNNAPGLPSFIDMLSADFRNDHRFRLSLHNISKWGGPNDAQLEVCGADEGDRLRSELLTQARKNGLRFNSLKDISRPGGQVCYAARPYNFLIGATGKVMKCTILLDTDPSNIVGHITEDGDLVLDDDLMATWTEPAYEQDSQCQKCVVLPNCQGISCPLVRMEEGRRPCVSTRSKPKVEMLAAVEAHSVREPIEDSSHVV